MVKYIDLSMTVVIVIIKLLRRILKITRIRNRLFRNVERNGYHYYYNRPPKVTGNLLLVEDN